MKRVKIIITGEVTGVFFRKFVSDNANELGLKGFVENVGDKVEAVLEGEEENINKLVLLCKKGPEGAKVVDIEIREEEYTGEFSDFKVKYI